MTPLNPLPWSHWNYRIFFQKCSCWILWSHWNPGRDPAVSLKIRKPILWSHWNPGTDPACGLIENTETNPVVSLKPRKPIPQSHWDRGIRTLQTIISNISAKTKLYEKQLYPIEQGPGGDCLRKKNQRVENLVTISLSVIDIFLVSRRHQN
jgi:hypothetical protein